MKDGRIKALLWLIYVILLVVLLPHTAWAASQFEPPGSMLGWAFAVAFELSIAALTWRYKTVIESLPKIKNKWDRARRKYLNWYSAGLLFFVGVSALANWSHAVQFTQSMTAFGKYSMPPLLYSIAFGGVLPFCSFLFAHILADTNEAEVEADPALEAAKADNANLRRQLRDAERDRQAAEQRTAELGQQFAGAVALAARLFAEDKRQRILAAREAWPQLPAAVIAKVADAAPSYVSEVLNEQS